MLKQYKLRFYNFRLMLFLLAVSAIGVVLVSTAREDLKYKQLAGVILGVVIMVILSLIDYSWISISSGSCTERISSCFFWCAFSAIQQTELQDGLILVL